MAHLEVELVHSVFQVLFGPGIPWLLYPRTGIYLL